MRETLWRNANRLYDGLNNLGYEVGPEASPVVAVKLGERARALDFWNRILEAGIYTNLMVPPASPNSSSYLRCSVSAAHSLEQMDTIIAAFKKLQDQCSAL